jgi:hypothetical protein
MKKSTIFRLGVFAALIGLCSCANNNNQPASQSPPPAQAQQAPPPPPPPPKKKGPIEDRLTVGMTKDDVRAAIGNPRNVSVNDTGTEVWTFSDREKAFIPFYAQSGGQFHTVIVFFDANGKVSRWSVNTTSEY